MFVEVVIIEDRTRAEALSDAMLDAGALSASIEDADAGSIDEQPIYGEPGMETPASGWKRSRIVALFDPATDIDAVLQSALAAAGITGTPHHERRDIADANWVALTQAQFDPIAIGERLWVVPSWHALPIGATADEAIVLRLDPGMAFGTGDHPTTRLCLAWLEQNLVVGETVIDYGCGSGILAIAAKLLGAGHVVGTDIDEQAIAASRTNAADNGVAIDFTPSTAFVGDGAQLVVANILSNPLKILAPLLASLVEPGGRLVLSGILERQWTEVAAVYAPAIALDLWRAEDGWVCLVGRKPNPVSRGS
ncbi:MAG: 50S ribosomal protein L11 methyltransferase [Burkholderiaceae bacterium]